MRLDRNSLLLYGITDQRWLHSHSLSYAVEEAILGGVSFIQLREKEADEKSLLQEAREIKRICHQYHVPFVLDDNVSLAKQIQADGVHVGQDDMPAHEVRRVLGDQAIIGVTAKTVEQALRAEKEGADYLGVGAVFPTSSKDDAKPISLQTLKDICQAVSIPIVAIGGITINNVCKLKGTGIAGVAVISAIFAKDDYRQAARELKENVEEILEVKKK